MVDLLAGVNAAVHEVARRMRRNTRAAIRDIQNAALAASPGAIGARLRYRRKKQTADQPPASAAEPVKRLKPRRRTRGNAFLPRAIGASGGVVLAALAFWFFREQANRMVEGRADALDTMLLDLVHSNENATLTRVLHWATQLGTHPGVGSVAGITAFAMLRQKRPHDAWTIALSTGGAMALNTLLKNIFQRQRPQELARRIKLPKSHSFPSGHSLLSAATFPIAAHYLVEKHSPVVQLLGHGSAAVVILSVGFSRVYFGVHFPSDVLAGFSAGLGWLGLTSLSHTVIDRERLQRQTPRG